MNVSDIFAAIADGTLSKEEGYELLVGLGDIAGIMAASAAGKVSQDEAMKLMAAIASKSITERNAAKKEAATAKAKGKSGRKAAIIKVGLAIQLTSQIKFPTSLYPQQWLELLDELPNVFAAIVANADALAVVNERFADDKDEVVARCKTVLGTMKKAA